MKNHLSICIPTHAIKTESRGLYNGMANNVPSAPSTKMIENVIEDMFVKTKLPRDIQIIIGVDNRIDRQLDNEYYINLCKLANRYNMIVMPTNSTTYDPLVSAPVNFNNIIGQVKTPYYMLLEHDWMFNYPINVESLVLNMIKYDQYYVRFNQHANSMGPHAAEKYMQIETKTDVPLLKVDHMGNNPYICKTEVYTKWWKNLLYETPEQGGFVEGPINVFYKFAVEKMGFEKASDQWKIYVYGRPNDPAAIRHLNGNTYQ